MRLLKFPKSVQRYIAAGDVPMDAEPLLRPIAEVSPRIAAAICEAGKIRELKGRRFVEGFGQLFEEASRLSGMKNLPTMIRVPRFHLSEVIEDLNLEKEEHKSLIERVATAFHSYRPDLVTDPVVQLAEAEIDAARAHGVLVEHVDRLRRADFPTGPDAYLIPNTRAGRISRQRIGKIVSQAATLASSRLVEKGVAPLPRTTPHTLRRTYISIALLANNFDVKWVIDQVGHSDSTMTMDVYTQLQQRADRQHGANFDRLIRRAKRQLAGVAVTSS